MTGTPPSGRADPEGPDLKRPDFSPAPSHLSLHVEPRGPRTAGSRAAVLRGRPSVQLSSLVSKQNEGSRLLLDPPPPQGRREESCSGKAPAGLLGRRWCSPTCCQALRPAPAHLNDLIAGGEVGDNEVLAAGPVGQRDAQPLGGQDVDVEAGSESCRPCLRSRQA